MQDNPLAPPASDSPLISFIITYHEEPIEMVSECIDSICTLSLSPSEREIILVDDGSATTPLPALQDIADQIIYIRQPNRGLSDARNTGIQQATGQWLQFVDADDKLIPSVYECCLDITRYKQTDMVMFDFTSNRQSATLNFEMPTSPVTGTQLLRSKNIHASACCYIFRRSILGNLRFHSGIYHEDEEFTPQLLLRAESVYATTQKAYWYRQRKGSITSATSTKKRLKRLHDTKAIILRLRDLSDTLPVDDRLAMQRRVAQLTMDYIYKIMTETSNKRFLNDELEQLRQQGLFPLPDRNYSQKYNWFRRLSTHRIGLNMMALFLPLLKKER